MMAPRLVPRTRSSHDFAAGRVANFGFKSGTGIIDLLVSFSIPKFAQKSRQMLANFGIGTLARALLLPLLLSACGAAQGDFGRLRTGLVDEDIHRWVGRDAARAVGVEPSRYPLTDEERTLRDLGYPLIEPPFDRARWYSIVNEYGVSHYFGWPEFRVEEYSVKLMNRHYRSATARYSQLNTDIRYDVVRIPDFFMTARRVLELDRKRTESFRFVAGLTPPEAGNANARVAENQLVV